MTGEVRKRVLEFVLSPNACSWIGAGYRPQPPQDGDSAPLSAYRRGIPAGPRAAARGSFERLDSLDGCRNGYGGTLSSLVKLRPARALLHSSGSALTKDSVCSLSVRSYR